MSNTGFIVVICLLALNGLVPFRGELLFGYLFWFIGFLLIQDDVLYLPRRIDERIILTKGEKDFLIALREKPLSISQALFILTTEVQPKLELLSNYQLDRLRILGATGLVEFHAETQTFYPSEELTDSYTAPGIAKISWVASYFCSFLIIVPCIVYFISPVDFLPEGFLGPIAYIDDLFLLALGALPLFSKRKELFLAAFRTIRPIRRAGVSHVYPRTDHNIIQDKPQAREVLSQARRKNPKS
ncbi:MAG: DUF1232 domain-containing protein [Candidatus Hydrogenedentes bacterium]|nr:DUF1232 domain-containing protein [Candidatus Hydrogenedentota bacterium]